MPKARYLFANAVILFIIGASSYHILFDDEHWPFSQYPMFSRATSNREHTRLRLYGVAQDGGEIALLRYAEIFPFGQSRLTSVFGSIADRPGADNQLRTAVTNCLERYERRRRGGSLEGPPLAGMRLYEVHWRLDPRAANVHHPVSRRLLTEVSR